MDASALLAPYTVIPVVVVEDAEQAVPLAETLLEAGLGALEITLRSDAALTAIERVARAVPDLLVGAGSVRQAGQFARIHDAGARFAVSPGATPALLDAATVSAMPFVPGAVTAGEILSLLERGYRLQKFFPAEAAGGTAMIRALSAPLPEARFFPTGGISAELAPHYLSLPAVSCLGGSWVAPAALLRQGDFDGIGALAREAAKLGQH